MKIGNLEGLVNGTEQVVFDYEVTGSPVSSISTGNILNGNEDGWYTIILRVASDTGGIVWLRLNGDSGTNYGRLGIAANGAGVSNSSGTGLTGMMISNYDGDWGGIGFSVARIYAKSGAVRLMNAIESDGINGTTVNWFYPHSNVWNNTADNIISISIVSAGNISVGSRLIILKSNNFTNGTRTGVITTPYIKGSWVRVGSTVLTSAASSVTFSGLDRDVVYCLKLAAKFASNIGWPNCITFNSDSNTNYGQQYLAATNTTVEALRQTAMTYYQLDMYGGLTDKYVSEIHFIFAKSGYLRTILGTSIMNVNGTTVAALETTGAVWQNTTDNITSIKTAMSTSTYAIGSQFELYALRPNG
jgi:hypothetical protein